MYRWHSLVKFWMLLSIFTVSQIIAQQPDDLSKITDLILKSCAGEGSLESYNELTSITDWHKTEQAKKTIPRLIGMLKKNDYNHKVVLFLLRTMETKYAAPYFVGILNLSDEDDLKTVCRLALAKLKKDAVPAILNYPTLTEENIRLLGSIGPNAVEAIPKLIVHLTDENLSKRGRIHVTLRKISPKWKSHQNTKYAISSLVLLLKDENVSRRKEAKALLEKIAKKWYEEPSVRRVIPEFIAALHRQTEVVKRSAQPVKKLSEQMEENTRQWKKLQKEMEERKQLLAQRKWYYSKSKESSIPKVIAQLERKIKVGPIEKENLSGILYVLKQLGVQDKQMTESLVEIAMYHALNSNDFERALSLLKSVPPDPPTFVKTLKNIVSSLRKSKYSQDKKSYLLKVQRIHLCEILIQSLGNCGERSISAIPLLVKLLRRKDGKIARLALNALYEVGSHDVGKIIQTFHTSKGKFPRKLLDRIVKNADRRSIPSLIEILKQQHSSEILFQIRDTTFETLESLDTQWYKDEATQEIIPMLVMDYCLRYESTGKELLDAIDPDWYVKDKVKKLIPELKILLEHDSWQARKKAYEVLALVDFEQGSYHVSIFEIVFLILLFLVILSIFSYSLYVLIKQGQLLVTANLIQPVLFCVLFYCIYSFLGSHYYSHHHAIAWYDWPVFTGSHILRAVDFIDFIEAYNISIQNIKHKSDLVGTLIVIMHCFVDLFLLATLITFVSGFLKKFAQRFDLSTKFVVRFFLCYIFLYVMTAAVQRWHPNDFLFLWATDNILRLIDVGDILQTFDWSLHSVEKTPWNATLAVVFRIACTVYLGKELEKYRIKISQGVGLTLRKVKEMLQGSDVQMKKIALKRLRELEQAEEAIGEVIACLIERNPTIRKEALKTLESMDEKWRDCEEAQKMINEFTALLRGQKGAIQHKAAIDTLGIMGSSAQKAIPDLIYYAKRSNVRMQKATEKALDKIDPKWRRRYALLMNE